MDEQTARWILDLVLIVGVLYAIWRGNPAAADDKLVSIIQGIIDDRERMAFAEKQVQHGMNGMQAALGAMGSVISELAKFTPIRADDKLGQLLSDLAQPGDPGKNPNPAPVREVIDVGDETIKG